MAITGIPQVLASKQTYILRIDYSVCEPDICNGFMGPIHS